MTAGSWAEISPCGTWRYALGRRWSGGPVMCWIMLNPSAADAGTDDATIRRVTGFAKRAGGGGICVLNLYALRSPEPAVLRGHPDPVGPDNDRWIAGAARGVADMVANVPVAVAWGASPLAAARVPAVLALLGGLPLACLGTTRKGQPRHPLYVRADAPLVPWAGS